MAHFGPKSFSAQPVKGSSVSSSSYSKPVNTYQPKNWVSVALPLPQYSQPIFDLTVKPKFVDKPLPKQEFKPESKNKQKPSQEPLYRPGEFEIEESFSSASSSGSNNKPLPASWKIMCMANNQKKK